MLKLNNRITEQLNIRYPIIQAPMAGGVTSTHLVKESAENGVLGMIGAGYLDTEALRDQVKEIKRLTDKPFGVNVFVPGEFQTTTEKINNARELLQPFYKQYGINAADIKLPNEGEGKDVYEKQLEVLLEEQISAISFTFGIPDSKWIQRLKDLQIPVIGTATSIQEALAIEAAGMDMMVLQGMEAGGHSGAFYNEKSSSLKDLITAAAEDITIPVIAAGGIMDGKDMMTALQLGAEAVQMGTAFLLTEESGAHSLHKQAILESKVNKTVVTKAFSGKSARGVSNSFIDALQPFEGVLPPFPIMNSLTQPIRKSAKEHHNKEWMSLWCGSNGHQGKLQSVKELISEVIRETQY